MVTQEWKQGSSQKVTAITIVLKHDTQILVYPESRTDRMGWECERKQVRSQAICWAFLKFISNYILNILTTLDKWRGKKVGSRK